MTPKQLAEEFRRLAAEAEDRREMHRETQEDYLVTFYNGLGFAYKRAAQMLEERLLESPTTQPPSSEP